MFLKRLYIRKCLKKLNVIRLFILAVQLKKTDYNTKINEIENKINDHGKYITTQKFNKLTSENFDGRLKQANFASKNDIAGFVKLKNISKKITSNKK